MEAIEKFLAFNDDHLIAYRKSRSKILNWIYLVTFVLIYASVFAFLAYRYENFLLSLIVFFPLGVFTIMLFILPIFTWIELIRDPEIGKNAFIVNLISKRSETDKWNKYQDLRSAVREEIKAFFNVKFPISIPDCKFENNQIIANIDSSNIDIEIFIARLTKCFTAYKKLGSPFINSNVYNSIEEIKNLISKQELKFDFKGERINRANQKDSSQTTIHASKSEINQTARGQEKSSVDGINKTNENKKTSFIARKIDWETVMQNRTDIGKIGEEIALELERDKLQGLQLGDLIFELNHVSQTKGDGLGYDILSFNETEEEIYVEVKTTTGGEYSDLYFTNNEIEFIKSANEKYCLYRIYNLDIDQRSFDYSIYYGANKVLSKFDFIPNSYKARIKN